MITVMNRWIPRLGCTAMTVWPLLLVRSDRASGLTGELRRHELTHARQQVEVLLMSLFAIGSGVLTGLSAWWLLAAPLVYFALYGLDFIARLALYRDLTEAYMNVAFEQEAYMNQDDEGYLDSRHPFAWLALVPRRTYRKQENVR